MHASPFRDRPTMVFASIRSGSKLAPGRVTSKDVYVTTRAWCEGNKN